MPEPREDQRRADILEAAFRVAAETRVAGITTPDVAAAAGVSNGLVFCYFPSREAPLPGLLRMAPRAHHPGRSAPSEPPSNVSSRSGPKKIRAALAPYRKAYLPLARAVVGYRGGSPQSLASVATGFVEGCGLPVVVDPRGFDVAAYKGAIRALVLRLP